MWRRLTLSITQNLTRMEAIKLVKASDANDPGVPDTCPMEAERGRTDERCSPDRRIPNAFGSLTTGTFLSDQVDYGDGV
jgi:hypothetical protein